MSTFVRIVLLSGRYHAHAWGEAHFGMAGPEWPPSPWRLLRALAASWFNASGRDCTESKRNQLLETLARCGSPTIWIPRVSFQEIPYYQPIVGEKGAKRVLHFDHFAVFAATDGEDATFYFEFPCELTFEQRDLLRTLLRRITYFGRAESRARLSLLDAGESPSSRALFDARPAGASSDPERRRRVLVPTSNLSARDLWTVDDRDDTHLVEALIKNSQALPTGTEWIDYDVRPGWVMHELPVSHARHPRGKAPLSALRATLFRRVPIPISDTVAVARDFRDQAVEEYRRLTGRESSRLSGRTADGGVCRGHAHAFYTPMPDRRTGRLAEIFVRIPGGEDGIEPEERDALLSVATLWRDDRYPILVVTEEENPRPTAEPARLWRSTTPYLPPLRFTNRRREALDPAVQVTRSLREVCGIEPVVSAMSGLGGSGRITPMRAHLYAGEGAGWRWTRRAGHWFEVHFPEPVVIPRPLGADAHFGLGLFEPARTSQGGRANVSRPA